MKHGVVKISKPVFLSIGLFLVMPWAPAQAGNDSQSVHQNPPADKGKQIGKPAMIPYMPSNGPTAPQNNIVFLKQHVSDTIRENMAVEMQLNQLALERSHNPALKSYARRVLEQDRKIALDANDFAPRPSNILPVAALAETRQAVDAKMADKKMRTLTGRKFDAMYLVQMSNDLRSDIQIGHSAYAMMDIPEISPLGRNLWDLSRARMDELAKIANQNHVHINTD